METQTASTASLIPYERNNRQHSQQQVDRIANSIAEFGFNQPIVVDENNIVLVGHGRLEAAKKLGLPEVPIVRKAGLTETQKKAYRILDNKLQNDSTWDAESLNLELAALKEDDFDFAAFGLDDLSKLFSEEKLAQDNESKKISNGKLSDRFMLPPFSVLNAREGWWQERKKAWLALGIKSELGRGAAPGGSARPACDYSNKQRGNGAGRPIT